MTFSIAHLFFLMLSFGIIIILLRNYKSSSDERKVKFQKWMAYFFLIEEFIYTIWLLMNCQNHLIIQILPLELCSLCVYINVCTVIFKKTYLRFFSGVVGLFAGLIAILYPVNISGLYPIVSYRVLNFYILHGSFILFALIQLQDRKLLSYKHLKINTLMLCGMFTIAYFVNSYIHSQYMFVGSPPSIGFIAQVYYVSGKAFFLPIVLLAVSLLQCIFLFILRKVFRIH